MSCSILVISDPPDLARAVAHKRAEAGTRTKPRVAAAGTRGTSQREGSPV